MPPITIVHSGTDTLAAWATFGAAVAAFAGLVVSIVLAVTERRAARKQRRTELRREERVLQIMEIARQYGLYLAATRLEHADQQANAQEMLKPVLSLMADGMVVKLKRQFGAPLGPKDKEHLNKEFPDGVPDTFPQDELLAELNSNNLNAGWGVPKAPQGFKRRLGMGKGD